LQALFVVFFITIDIEKSRLCLQMPTERKQKKPTHTNVPTDRGIPAVVMGSTYGPVLAYVDPQTPPKK
jgi:hypothetical protein